MVMVCPNFCKSRQVTDENAGDTRVLDLPYRPALQDDVQYQDSSDSSEPTDDEKTDSDPDIYLPKPRKVDKHGNILRRRDTYQSTINKSYNSGDARHDIQNIPSNNRKYPQANGAGSGSAEGGSELGRVQVSRDQEKSKPRAATGPYLGEFVIRKKN
jgi:hypothetical protein